MFSSLRAKLREKRGFTLMEMMLVVAITAVLGGLITAGIYGYLTTAYMTRVNDTAKTVFFAAQTYLTEQKQLGKLEKWNQTAEGYGELLTEDELKEILLANDSSLDFAAYRDKYGTNTVRYLKLDAGQGMSESDNPIYTVVKNYLNDDDLLEHTFLMEYDARTGVVRSVFYTEKADSFSYEGDRQDKANVVLRDAESLREKRQGYYGVESTSLAKTDIDLYAPKNAVLMNGERLYVKWQEANFLSPEEIRNGGLVNANEAFDDVALRSFLVYDVSVCRTSVEGEELLFTVSGLKPSMARGSTLVEADEAAGDGIRMTYDSDTNVYQLLLDDIDHSIYETFSMEHADSLTAVSKEVQASDMLYCRISVRLDGHDTYSGESDGTSTNIESANFAGGVDRYSPTMLESDQIDVFGNGNLAEDGSAPEYGKAFSIANARHLNNMRYASADACFIQTADIDWKKPEADRSETDVCFEPLTFVTADGGAPIPPIGGMALGGLHAYRMAAEILPGARAGETSSEVFTGSFQNGYAEGQDYVISHLKIDKLTGASPEKYVGMFRQNAGTIQKLHIEDAVVRGAGLTGVVAGSNRGRIEGVRLSGCSVEAVYYAGGVTGYNYADGELEDITVDADVSAVLNPDTAVAKESADAAPAPEYGWYFGGVAGVNQGKVKKVRTADTEEHSVSGAACVGGLVGANRCGDLGILGVGKKAEVTESVNGNTVKTAGVGGTPVSGITYQDFGGISGVNEKDGSIWKCQSKQIIFLERDAADPEYIQNIGGIAGRNQGTLSGCMNEAGTAQDAMIGQLTKECVEKASQGRLPLFSGVNVGGIAGFNETDGTIADCGSANIVAGYRNVGGIAGRNAGKLTCEAGILGIGSVLSEEERCIKGVVAATKESAGGIAGTNEIKNLQGYTNEANIFAGSLSGGIVGANGGMGAYQFTSAKTDTGYYTELLTPGFERKDAEAAIVSCENRGFVYALERYAGGITGVNLGKVESCGSTVILDSNRWLKDLLNDEVLGKMARADCVGGMTGANFGSVTGNNLVFATTRAGVCGRDFVGGVAGLNTGAVKNIQKVLGTVWSEGIGVGGILGVNMNAESLNTIALADGMQIEGGYFVGGIIGMNITKAAENPKIENLVTQIQERQGWVRGTAYVGGILGYNTSLSAGQDMSGLFQSEVKPLIEKAFQPYTPSAGGGEAEAGATVFKGCISRSDVYADRYLGGIVGYNGETSPLYIIDSINYGNVEVTPEGQTKTTDGYYFIGGITGRNSASGVIHQCINDGSVKSPSRYLGGICEVNEGYIQFCTVGKSENYRAAGITGDNSVGGLVGLNSNYVVQCTTSQYAKIKGGNNTGGIVGTNDVNGVITGDASKAKIIAGITTGGSNGECTAAGRVEGKQYTGGIAGLNQGQVELVKVDYTAFISGTVYVGGFIGSNEGTISQEAGVREEKVIRNLDNHAEKVIGQNEVGGIVGSHNADKIENCRNYGAVQLSTGQVGNVGGITGSVAKDITIEKCENYGEVTGNAMGSYAGGITGLNKKGGKIKNCKNFGIAVSEKSQAGGIVGNNSGTLEECKNFGSVRGALCRDAGGQIVAVGGVAGMNTKDGKIKNCASKQNTEGLGNLRADNAVIGAYTVGGIIGYNQGTLQNTTEDTLLVTIPIRTPDQQIDGSDNGHPSRIGGVVGRDTTDGTLKNFVYSGTIEVTSKGASKHQRIGGILGEIENSKFVLENCRMIGKITGYGNNGNDNGGIGGLAGVSRGKIIVYPNHDGIYTACTDGVLIEGNENVGGLVGRTEKGYGLYLKKDESSEAVKQEQIAENQDTEQNNDLFYTNLASVSGAVRVGGCYGILSDYRINTDNSTDVAFNHYRNGYQRSDGSIVGGKITPNTKPQVTCQAIGGIIGSTNSFSAAIHFSDLYNYGTIGSQNMGGVGAERIGGLIGSSNGGNEKRLHDCANYGLIESTAQYTGGILGAASQMTISDSYNCGEIIAYSGAGKIGGIIGGMKDAPYSLSIENCENRARISTKWQKRQEDTRVGGVAGYVTGTTEITACRNQGEMVLPNAARCGGIVGYVEATGNASEGTIIQNCENAAPMKECAQQTGGIAGDIYGSWKSSKLEFRGNVNKGEIGAKWRSGGLIGRLEAEGGNSKNWTIEDCRNEGDIYPLLAGDNYQGWLHEHGGCIGYMKTNAKIQNFVNTGDMIIDQSLCKGQKPLTNVHDLGGIVGRLTGSSYSTDVNLYQCINKGEICVRKVGDLSGTVCEIGGIVGGIDGRCEKAAVLYQCRNQGAIRIQDLGILKGKCASESGRDVAETGLHNIGGIAGKAGGNVLEMKSCVNEAEINVSDYTASDVKNIGGIVGNLRAKGKLLYCTNQASVVTDSKPAHGGCNVGGIAGLSSGLVYACSTENPSGEKGRVIGKTAVGGIVGTADGNISKLAAYKSERGDSLDLIENVFDVSGMQMAGGIVGQQKGATIMSAVNSNGVTITLLDGAADQKETCAGGIVGMAATAGSGVLVNCYNFGEVRFEADAERYLGGLVGYRDGTGQKKAVSVKDSFYLQDSSYDRIAQSLPDASFQPDKQCLAIGNEPVRYKDGKYAVNGGLDAEDQVFGLLQGESLNTPERYRWSQNAYETMYNTLHGEMPADSSKWADQQSVMQEIMSVYDRYKLPVPETEGVISGEVYDYTLQVTKMPGFCDKLKLWLYSGEFTKEQIEQVANSDTTSGPLPIMGPIEQTVTMDGQLVNIGFQVSNLSQYIGRPVKVALQAVGVSDKLTDDSQIVYTNDSDIRVVEEFIIMPPLVTPDMEMISQEEVTKITFRIKNWAEYQKSAGEIYAAIRDNTNTKDQPIYEKLVNGLLRFEVVDHYNSNQNGNQSSKKETHVISPSDIDEQGRFTIDYANSPTFLANRSALQWHYWETKAIATHSIQGGSQDAAYWSVNRQDVENVSPPLYRYTTSKVGTCKFQIKDRVPLEPPTELSFEYMGGMDADGASDAVEDTPSYLLRFTRSTSPQEAIDYYLITVQNPANGKTYQLQYRPEPLPEEEDGGDDSGGDGSSGSGGDGSGGSSGDGSGDGEAEEPIDRTCSILLDKETLLGTGDNQLGLDLSSGTAPVKLKYTAQAIRNDSEAAQYFLDSEEKTIDSPEMLKKGWPVEEPFKVTVENPDSEDTKYQWKYEWTDVAHKESGDTYLVFWRVMQGDTVIQSSDSETEVADQYYVWDVKDYQAEGNILELFVRRKGTERPAGTVARLHSDPVSLKKEIGKKLTDVTEVNAEFVRLENGSLIYDVSFQIPPELTKENCKGFSITPMAHDGSAALGMETELAWDDQLTDQLPVEIKVPVENNRGKSFYFVVKAKALLPGEADSEGKQSSVLKIPNAQLTAPKEIQVLVQQRNADGSERYDYNLTDAFQKDSNSFLAEEYEGMEYVLEWQQDSSVIGAAIKGQHMELLAPQETADTEPECIWKKETESNQLTWKADDIPNLQQYAGQELTFKIFNSSNAPETFLPSETVSVPFYVPFTRLDEPEQLKAKILDRDGSEIAADQPVAIDSYGGLQAEISWKVPDDTEQIQRIGKVKIHAVAEKQPEQEGGDVTTQPMSFTMDLNGNAYTASDDSGVEISWDELTGFAESGGNMQLILQDMSAGETPEDLAEQKITVYISYLAKTGEDGNPAWKDSEESEISWTMPSVDVQNANLMLLEDMLLIEEGLLPEEETEVMEEETESETEAGEGTETETGGENGTGGATETGTEGATETETGGETRPDTEPETGAPPESPTTEETQDRSDSDEEDDEPDNEVI